MGFWPLLPESQTALCLYVHWWRYTDLHNYGGGYCIMLKGRPRQNKYIPWRTMQSLAPSLDDNILYFSKIMLFSKNGVQTRTAAGYKLKIGPHSGKSHTSLWANSDSQPSHFERTGVIFAYTKNQFWNDRLFYEHSRNSSSFDRYGGPYSTLYSGKKRAKKCADQRNTSKRKQYQTRK